MMELAGKLLGIVRDERLMLATLGLATIAIVRSMYATLEDVRDENEIPPVETKAQYITQDTEDALQLDTLGKLLDHPTYSIREVGVKILCDRAVNDSETTTFLLRGITRPNYDDRMQCLRALALLTGQTAGLEGLSKLHNERAYSALVRSLELSLTDTDRPSLANSHWDEYYLRDMAERFCLMFVLELITKYGADMLVKAGFVEKWLVKQDWGSGVPERHRNFWEYKHLKSNRIVDIINGIMHSRRGLEALRKAELVVGQHKRGDATNGVGDGTGSRRPPSEEAQIPRAREHSAEEERLRRQRREAMVLNDGTRPLRRDDIIEREYELPD